MGDDRLALTTAALHELHAPATSQSRRQELQGMLGLEKQLVVADAGLRSAWCGALGSTQDEFVLWFALSACDASLTAPVGHAMPAAERSQLKAALQNLLLASSAGLPKSARNKAALVFSHLVRVAWPAEEPSLVHEVLSLLQQPGANRGLGAQLLATIAEEFASADDERQRAFVAAMPDVHAALAGALQSEAGAREAPSGASAEAQATALLCLEAARACICFGRSHGSTATARVFTEPEARMCMCMCMGMGMGMGMWSACPCEP